MKKKLTLNGIRLLAISLVAAGIAACQVPESERFPGVFALHPSTETPDALQTSVTLELECDFHWTAELLDSSWGTLITQEVKEGEGGTLLFKMNANLEDAPRENTIIVKAGKGELRQKITQGGMDTFFSPRELVMKGTDEYAISFNAPTTWTARITDGTDWLRLKNTLGDAGPSRLVCFAKDANENLGTRRAYVKISIGLNMFLLTVDQVQKDVVLSTDTDICVPFDRTNLSVQTRYNVDYQVSTSAPWIAWVPTKAPLSEAQENFSLTENRSAEARSAQILFTSEGHPDASLTITVTQDGKDPITDVTTPGLYGTEFGDATRGTEGWNQTSYLKKADGSVRVRMFNAAMLTVITLTGYNENFERGKQFDLKAAVQMGGISLANETYPVTLVHSTSELVWLKGENGEYCVLRK